MAGDVCGEPEELSIVYAAQVLRGWGGVLYRGDQRDLTHTLTHTGKRADGDNGRKSAGKSSAPNRRGHKSARKQQTPPSQSVGKDEVTGSNPDSSSRITPDILGFLVFSFAFHNFLTE